MDQQGATILVVEDADAIRRILVLMLNENGYRCLEATDGTEALGVVEREHVDLVLTDVVMPNMGGHELAAKIARLKPGIPIIFMSGYSDHPLVQSFEQDSPAFLAKPFTAAALLEKIRNALGQSWPGLPAENSDAA